MSEVQELFDKMDEVDQDLILPLIAAIASGDVKQMVIVYENADGQVMNCHRISDDASRFVMLGALEVVKHEYMLTHIQMATDLDNDGDEDEFPTVGALQ